MSLSRFFFRTQKPQIARMVAVIAVVVLLHLLAFQWAEGRLTLPAFPQSEDKVVTTVLLAPPDAPQVTTAPATLPKHRAPPAKRKPEEHTSPTVATPPSEATDSTSLAGMEAPGTSVEQTIDEPPLAPSAPPPQNDTSVKIDPPPAAQLTYDVEARQKGQTYFGHGGISWQTTGNRYAIDGDAGVLFLKLLNFRSEGTLDGFGVSPVIYSEKRFRRSETATHFHRERNTISFSASTLTYPRKGGEQDRASVVWQLAGMGRGDSSKFIPGTDIDLMVAGVRDAEVWRIHVVGQEEVQVGRGKFLAWHVSRLPRPGSYEQALDIWFAPQQEWYPVRLRFTETNGDYLDMSLSNLTMGKPSS